MRPKVRWPLLAQRRLVAECQMPPFFEGKADIDIIIFGLDAICNVEQYKDTQALGRGRRQRIVQEL
jgi:hypothetical protein